MALRTGLIEWSPKEAAEITGVSPDLQRQWRKLGVLTPLNSGEKRSRYSVIALSYVVAARALIDNGASHKNIRPLINHLAPVIFNLALLTGRWNIREPITEDEAGEAIASIRHVMYADLLSARFFAYRNDPPALDSAHRCVKFDDFADLTYWLNRGVPPELPDVVRPGPNGEAEAPYEAPELTPEEQEEDERWRAENPPEPPLPPTHAAVIIDAEALTRELLDSIGGPIGEVWDDQRDALVGDLAAMTDDQDQLGAEIDRLFDEVEALIAKGKEAGPGDERERLRRETQDLLARLDQLMAKKKEALDQKDALIAQMVERREAERKQAEEDRRKQRSARRAQGGGKP